MQHPYLAKQRDMVMRGEGDKVEDIRVPYEDSKLGIEDYKVLLAICYKYHNRNVCDEMQVNVNNSNMSGSPGCDKNGNANSRGFDVQDKKTKISRLSLTK